MSPISSGFYTRSASSSAEFLEALGEGLKGDILYRIEHSRVFHSLKCLSVGFYIYFHLQEEASLMIANVTIALAYVASSMPS